MSAPFPCSACGACCKRVDMVPAIIRGPVVVPGPNGDCIHLTADNKCDIYNTRPRRCRVDDIKPALIPTSLWHSINLYECDRMHIRVYGIKRVPL